MVFLSKYGKQKEELLTINIGEIQKSPFIQSWRIFSGITLKYQRNQLLRCIPKALLSGQIKRRIGNQGRISKYTRIGRGMLIMYLATLFTGNLELDPHPSFTAQLKAHWHSGEEILYSLNNKRHGDIKNGLEFYSKEVADFGSIQKKLF